MFRNTAKVRLYIKRASDKGQQQNDIFSFLCCSNEKCKSENIEIETISISEAKKKGWKFNFSSFYDQPLCPECANKIR